MRRRGGQRVADLRGAGGGHLQGQACQAWAQPRPAETGSRAGALLEHPHRRKGSVRAVQREAFRGFGTEDGGWAFHTVSVVGTLSGKPQAGGQCGGRGAFHQGTRGAGQMLVRERDGDC